MKNLKMILSLTTLIAVGNMHALTLGQKREFQGAIAAVEAKKTLTQAQKDIITKYISMKRDADIEAGINRLTKAGLPLDVFRNEEGIKEPESTPIQETAQETTAKPQTTSPTKPLTLAERRQARGGKQPEPVQKAVTPTPQAMQETARPQTISTGKPLTLAERRQAREGKQPEPVQKAVTPTPQAMQETARPQTISTGKPLTLAERRLAAQGKQVAAPTVTGLASAGKVIAQPSEPIAQPSEPIVPPTLSSAEKATATLIYDENNELLKEHGIEIYVKNEKNKYPSIKDNLKLISAAYDDAAAILKVIRDEDPLDKTFSDKLMRMISNAVYSPKAPLSSLIPIPQSESSQLSKSQEALERLKKDVSLTSNIKDQIKLLKSGTAAYPDAFFYNNELRPDWFAFAKEIVGKSYTDESEVNEVVTQLAREMLQLILLTKKLPEKWEKAITTEVEWVMF